MIFLEHHDICYNYLPPILTFSSRKFFCVLTPRIMMKKHLIKRKEFQVHKMSPTIELSQSVAVDDHLLLNDIANFCPLIQKIYYLSSFSNDEYENIGKILNRFKYLVDIELDIREELSNDLINSILHNGLQNKITSLSTCGTSLNVSKEYIEKFIGSMKILRSLNLRLNLFEQKELFLENVNPELQKLHLSYNTNTDDSLVMICDRFYVLKSLYLYNCLGIADENFLCLSGLNFLELINLCNVDIDTGLKAVVGMKFLNIIILKKCLRLSNKSLIYLIKLNSLQHIEIYDNPKFGNEGVEYISLIKNLKTINLNSFLITDQGLMFLKNLKELTYIELFNCSISNIIFEYFSELPRLMRVVTFGGNITLNCTEILDQCKFSYHICLASFGKCLKNNTYGAKNRKISLYYNF